MSVWLNEAASLDSVGVSTQSCTIHFEGPYETAEHVWSKLKSIAAFYDAAVRCVQNGKPPYATRKDLIDAFVDEKGTHTDPETLVRSVRQVLSGASIIQLPCAVGTISDFEAESRHVSSLLEGQSQAEWEQYRLSIVEGYLDDAYSAFKDIQSVYVDFPES